MFTLAKRFDDEGEVEEAEERDIEFLEAREDSAEAFESPEEPFDFVGSPLPTFGAMQKTRFTAFRTLLPCWLRPSWGVA